MDISELLSYATEENVLDLLDRYRSFGPLPGIFLTFLKSFVPPLPTIVIVGANAAAYGLWLGFLYSWIGMVCGCMATFLIIRRIAETRFADRWARHPKVQRSLRWVRRNAFSYVFILGMFPVGPFVVINIAAGIARMRVRSFLIATLFGKAIMVFMVSYIGHDIASFMRHPEQVVYLLLFVALSLIVSKKIERRFTRESGVENQGSANGFDKGSMN